jgi:hypothetical protein
MVEARSQSGRDRLVLGLGRILADNSSSRKVRRPNRGHSRGRLVQPLHHPLLRCCPLAAGLVWSGDRREPRKRERGELLNWRGRERAGSSGS